MKKIISVIILVCMILTALPLSVSAGIRVSILLFPDVPETAWYYEAVKYVFENGYFNWVHSRLFLPKMPVSRAGFVAALSKLDKDYDEAKYDGDTGFSDVPVGSLYSKAICWAVENKIANGTGKGTFSPTQNVTREQIAVMMKAYYTYKGTEFEDTLPSDLLKYGDADKVHEWAKDAVAFTSHFRLMSGKGTVKGAPMFDPGGIATRAEVAQIFYAASNVNFKREVPINDLRLNGVSISDYSIVYGETASRLGPEFKADKIAETLRSAIFTACGVDLPVYKDSDKPNVELLEIRIGRTDREDKFPVDREGLTDDSVYYALEGNTLIIASSEEFCGTYCAAYDFLQRELGITYYGPVTTVTPCEYLNVPSGAVYRYTPLELYRMNYQNKNGASVQFHNETEGMSYREVNLMHNLSAFAQDDFENRWGYIVDYMTSAETPCISDDHNIDNIIRSVKTTISDAVKAGRTSNMIWLTQPDNNHYCRCEKCVKVYRTWGRFSTYTHLIRYVCDAIKDEYPDWYVLGMAYEYSIVPPRTDVGEEEYASFLEDLGESKYIPSRDVKYPENSILCVCTDQACNAHAINDPRCKNAGRNNNEYYAKLRKWTEICDKIIIWDYVVADNYKHQAFPNIVQMYENFKLYNDLGVVGSYVLGHMSDYGDFAELRSYLVSKLQWEKDMTRKEYYGYVDSFLEAFYGPGWTYVREYIDLMQELSAENEWNIWGGNVWDRILTPAQYADHLEELKGLWTKALELAKLDGNEAQYKNCLQTAQEVWYVELMIEYEKYHDTSAGRYPELMSAYKQMLIDAELDVPVNFEADPNTWTFD